MKYEMDDLKEVSINDLHTADPFKSLFPVIPEVLSAITESIGKNGFDISKPINVWDHNSEFIVLDGHTRLQAARQNGLSSVPVYIHDFDTEEEALSYAISNQRNRRNMTDAELIRCIEVVDKRKQRGGDRKSAAAKSKVQPCAFDNSDDQLTENPSNKEIIKSAKEKSVQETARIVGVSPRKVEQTRTLIYYATPEVKQDVMEGKKSINKAYTETQQKRKPEKNTEAKHLTFERISENLEWASWEWNPVEGCKQKCPYCDFSDTEPCFFDERLNAPHFTKVPDSAKANQGDRSVFVCSRGDLFGEGVLPEWIEAVMEEIEINKQWNFIILTRNPERCITVDVPKNCWIGVTVDTQERADVAVDILIEMRRLGFENVLFLSCELKDEAIHIHDKWDMTPDGEERVNLSTAIDWIIIGGRSKSSNMPEFQPEWDWVENLLRDSRRIGMQVYFKPNLTVRPTEYPDLSLDSLSDSNN